MKFCTARGEGTGSVAACFSPRRCLSPLLEHPTTNDGDRHGRTAWPSQSPAPGPRCSSRHTTNDGDRHGRIPTYVGKPVPCAAAATRRVNQSECVLLGQMRAFYLGWGIGQTLSAKFEAKGKRAKPACPVRDPRKGPRGPADRQAGAKCYFKPAWPAGKSTATRNPLMRYRQPGLIQLRLADRQYRG